jgi:peptide deformylase
MALLNILEFPDPQLRTVAKPVEQVSDDIRQLVDDMLETMYAAPDVSDEQDDPLVFINPEVIPVDDDTCDYDEGCLSVPGFYESVTRPAHVKVTALDRNGDTFELQPEGLLAVCIQHEIDHLDGKLFVDYLSPLKRSRIRSKLEKAHRRQA